MSKYAFLLCFLLMAALPAYGEEDDSKTKPEAQMASVEMLTGTCVACHGVNGNSAGPATPSIAGFTYHYLLSALLAYKHDDMDGGDIEDMLEADYGLEDMEVMERDGTIMARISKGYSFEELQAIARYFSEQSFQPARQEYDADMARVGAKLHDQKCDKCHEDGGRSPVDDVGILAGQWAHYLRYTLVDYHAGSRDMPSKMKTKLKEIWEDYPEEGIEALIQYYASIKK